jgi:hypothetical protein
MKWPVVLLHINVGFCLYVEIVGGEIERERHETWLRLIQYDLPRRFAVLESSALPPWCACT